MESPDASSRAFASGPLPFHVAGKQRRLRLVDVLAYRDRMDERAEAALTALTMGPKRWACTASSRETRVEPSALGVPWIRATTADRER